MKLRSSARGWNRELRQTTGGDICVLQPQCICASSVHPHHVPAQPAAHHAHTLPARKKHTTQPAIQHARRTHSAHTLQQPGKKEGGIPDVRPDRPPNKKNGPTCRGKDHPHSEKNVTRRRKPSEGGSFSRFSGERVVLFEAGRERVGPSGGREGWPG
jgi:hypothetical protein